MFLLMGPSGLSTRVFLFKHSDLLKCIRIIVWDELEHLDIVNSLWCPDEDHKSTGVTTICSTQQQSKKTGRSVQATPGYGGNHSKCQSSASSSCPLIVSKMDGNTCWKHLQIIWNCPSQACLTDNYKDAHKAKRARQPQTFDLRCGKGCRIKKLQRRKDQLHHTCWR